MRASERSALASRRDLRVRNEKASYVHWLEYGGPSPSSEVVSLAQHRACLYLIRHGMTFGAQFGYQNAPEIARQHRAATKAGKKYVR